MAYNLEITDKTMFFKKTSVSKEMRIHVNQHNRARFNSFVETVVDTVGEGGGWGVGVVGAK